MRAVLAVGVLVLALTTPQTSASAADPVAPAPPMLTTAVSPSAVPPGGRLTLTGTVSPPSAAPLIVSESRPGDGLKFIAEVHPAADGRWSLELGVRHRVGRYVYEVSSGADQPVRDSGNALVTATVSQTGAGRASDWAPAFGTKRRPVRWDTCRIDYRVNPRMMPAYGMADLREAMRRVTKVSGIRFRYLGRSAQVPARRFAGPGHNEVLVAWGTNKSTNGLLGTHVGRALATRSHGRLDTGWIVLNANSKWNGPGFGAGGPLGWTIMHELGHVVGLGHAHGRSQVMHPWSVLPAAMWGAGDLAGLRALGAHCR